MSFKRYSPLNRDEVHADMRADPEGTRAAVAAQPGVLRAHKGCQTCEELDPRRAQEFSRRAQVVMSISDVAAALPLPPDARPVRMYVLDDPQLLHLVFESETLEPVSLRDATPITLLADEDTLSVETA